MQLYFLKRHVLYGIFLSISSLIFLLYITSVAHYLTHQNENSCEMTYMFEYPQYVVGTSENYLILSCNLSIFT
jgi:hypothetical protein